MSNNPQDDPITPAKAVPTAQTTPPAYEGVAPAPAVVSQIETVSPAVVAVTPAVLPSEGDPVPVSASPLAVETTPAEVPAQAMQVAMDPAAPPTAAASDPPASGGPPSNTAVPVDAYSPPFVRTPASYSAPRSPARKVIVAISALIVGGAAALVGISILNGIERNKIEQDLRAIVANAETAYASSDISSAAELALKAKQTIANSPQELDAELTKKSQTRIAHFVAMKIEADQLDKVFAEAEKDLSGVRSRLENKKALYGAATPDNQPIAAKVDALLLDVGKIELRRKQERLRNDLAQADALYKEGKIEDASERAVEIGRQLADKPPLQDAEIEKRLSILRQRAEKLKTIKGVRMAARGDTYADARRKIQQQLDALDESNEDLKPLYQRIAALKNDLIQEEKRSRKLSPEESTRLEAVAGLLARRNPSLTRTPVEGDTIGLAFDGKPLRMGFQRTALADSLFLEANGIRMQVEPKDLERRAARVLTHALAVSAAMQKAGIHSDDLWSAVEESPFLSARRTGDDGKEYIFLGDRLYGGKPQEKTASEKEVAEDFKKKAEALERAVENDAGVSEDIRRVVAVAVRAAFKEADWYDHLPGDFVRKVISEGYIENNMPGAAGRLKKELADFRDAYAQINNPGMRFSGLSAQGDEAIELRTFEEHAVWRLYSKSADTTTFAIKNPDDERNCLFILYDFPGRIGEFPAATPPRTVRMTHQAAGVTATYDLAADKMSFDPIAWHQGVILESPMIPDAMRINKGVGPPGWCLPPHVLLVDMMGNTRSIVTPHGRLDVEDFSKISDPAKRAEAMEVFLNKLAKVLPTADYMHLYFRYFLEYILDSPITSATGLLGSRSHCGDIHQTTTQSLARLMGGRYVGDCDDLAEFFMNVTRRQGKLSYVMALPQHAACGWAEKPPGANEYTFYVLDTGPPRMFKHADLEKAIELAFRAYDEDRTMRFDPKSLGFLFRFNGEPTRTPYYLSSRMYTDREYGDVMERVQGYWHWHFYALGIEKMTEMITKGDRVPENCIELAGLYGMVREVEDSIKWTREALKQLGPQERLSRMNEEFRIAMMWREERDNEKTYEAVKGLAAELKALQSDPKSLNFVSLRIQVMNLLLGIDRPWEAWDLVARDMNFFAQRGILKIEHAGGLTALYEKMKDMIRKGKQPTAEENDKLSRLDRLLAFFYERALFEPEDDFNDYMRKYAFVGLWYGGKYGHERVVAELLKDKPDSPGEHLFPDPATPRNHPDRKNPEAEDWKWIRLSIPSYGMAIGDALDLDESPEKWRREEAVKLTDAMLKAAEQARKFGSLSSSEFQLLSSRVFRAFLVKDWADLEKVLVDVKGRDWARLTSDIAETFGRSARFVTPEEFVAQYRVFTKHIKARTAYFTVIYEAYRGEAIEQAVAATKVALECWPGDADMKREAEYLEKLAKKKTEAKAKAKEAEKPAAAPEPKAAAPEPKAFIIDF